jgi:chromosome partitioning protein
MFDSRLRLSNQVVEEVQKHFGKMVFKTIIQRNIRLSEGSKFWRKVLSIMMPPVKGPRTTFPSPMKL